MGLAMRLDQRLLGNRFVTGVLGWLLAYYTRAVYYSARRVVEPDNAFDIVRAEAPAIFAFWHGFALLAPASRPLDLAASVMIARNVGAGIGARAIEINGLGTIRASGAHAARAALRKGGAAGFLKALEDLRVGRSVMMSADVPKVAREAGRGILMLAKASGRPIIPSVYVTARAIHLDTWDRLVIDLPFSRAAIVHGAPMRVPADADDDTIEALRLQLSSELDRITERAYQRAGANVDRGNGTA